MGIFPWQGRGAEHDLSALCTWHAWGLGPLLVAPRHTTPQRCAPGGPWNVKGNLEGVWGVVCQLLSAPVSMITQLASKFSALLPWFLESGRTRAMRLWFFQVQLQQLFQENLPTTALPLHTSHLCPGDCWGFFPGQGWGQQSLALDKPGRSSLGTGDRLPSPDNTYWGR